MLSLYIHIPFCEKKCSYCNFFVIPTGDIKDKLIKQYEKSLLGQIDFWAKKLSGTEIKTIHIGGGSPQIMGKDSLMGIIDYIGEKFDLSFLEELGIELNPYPYDETLELVRSFNAKYKNYFRLRYSFGIQSFDDKILKDTGRAYFFNYLVGYLRELTKLKGLNNVFNFDFICFGIFNENKDGSKVLWDQHKITFFDEFVASGFADSFSLYALELFPGSMMFAKQSKDDLSNDDLQDIIYHEFDILKNKILEQGYKRYEISNFAHIGKGSIHNRVYWQMKNYLGLGISASSFLNQDYISSIDYNLFGDLSQDDYAIRFDNSVNWKGFLNGDYINKKSITYLDKNNLLLESFILGMRTEEGIFDLNDFKHLFVSNYENQLDSYFKDGLLQINENQVVLTDRGMDLYNQIVLNLLKEI